MAQFDDTEEEDDVLGGGAASGDEDEGDSLVHELSAQRRTRKPIDFSDLIPEGDVRTPSNPRLSKKAIDFSDLIPPKFDGGVPQPRPRPSPQEDPPALDPMTGMSMPAPNLDYDQKQIDELVGQGVPRPQAEIMVQPQRRPAPVVVPPADQSTLPARPELAAPLTPSAPPLGWVQGATSGEEPQSFGGVVTQALTRGTAEGLSETADAFRDWHEKKADEDKSYLGKLLQTPISGGYKSADWWGAQMAYGLAKSSPSLAAAVGLGAAGGAMAGPAGALGGSIAGFGAGSAIQELAPAYQRARQAGLSHEDAVNRAWLQSGIAGAFGAAMGAVPGGAAAQTSVKAAVGKALGDIFVSLPAIGVAHQSVSAKIEDKPLTLEDLAQSYILNAASGGVLVGAHKAISALTGKAQPQPSSSPEEVSDFLRRAREGAPDAFTAVSPMVDEFQREVLKRSGYNDADLDAMSPADRQKAYRDEISKGGFGNRGQQATGPQKLLTPPSEGEGQPSGSPARGAPEQPSGGPSPNMGVSPAASPEGGISPTALTVSATERRALRKRGYSDEQIDGMNRPEIAEELGDQAGVPEPAEGERGVAVPEPQAPQGAQAAPSDVIIPPAPRHEAPATEHPPEQPSAEPLTDIAAQVADLKAGKRDAVWLPKATVDHLTSLGETDGTLSRHGVVLRDFDGEGGVLVARDRAVARQARKDRTSGIPFQEIVGRLTGDGTGKPPGANTVVQQADAQGNVTRERLATEEDVPAVAQDFAAPGRSVEVKSGTDALTERAAKVAAEQQGKGLDFTDLLPDGSRNTPAKVTDAEDIRRAAQRVEEAPTPAQQEAENYRMGHIRWPGLGKAISIETKPGGTRTAANRSWKVENFPAAYGRIKGTRGADGQQVDAFMGPEVNAPNAFIIDQYDPATGKFDEHKVMLGFADQAAAERTYDAAFSDGSGPQRRGAVGTVTISALKKWLARGRRVQPFSGPRTLTRTAEQASPESMTPAGGAPTQQELHGEQNAKKAVDDALAAIGIPSEAVHPADVAASAKIVADTGKSPADAFLEVMEAQLPKEAENAEPGATSVHGGDEGTTRGGRPTEGELVPRGGEALGDEAGRRGEASTGGEAGRADLSAEGAEAEPRKTGDTAKADDAEGLIGEKAVNRSATLATKFADHLREGESFGNILAARKMAKEAGFDGNAKAVEEAMELAVVKLAREIAADRTDPRANFTALVDLYSRQPKLGTRTSTSMRDQAFSTPVPLAYVASRLAKIGPQTAVFEPTAGNGALLIETNPAHASVNELNSDRAASLRSQGFDVTTDDASENMHVGAAYDAVLANPPFGALRQDGESKVFDLSDIQKGYKTKEIDHAIALRALSAMRDNGRAALIIGGLNKMADTAEKRSDAYNGKAKREFFKVLYDRYNVTDHFTVAGELYERQGAGWPVDVIVIDGRGKSERALPAVDVPRILKTWDELGGLIDGSAVSRPSEPASDRVAEGASGTRPGERNGGVRGDGERVLQSESGSVGPGEVRTEPVQRAGDDRAGGEGREVAAGNERGDAERTGDQSAAERPPHGITPEAAVSAALDEAFGPQAGPKSSQGNGTLSDKIKAAKLELRQLRKEMREQGIAKVSSFNGGLDRATLSFNQRRFALETQIESLEKSRPTAEVVKSAATNLTGVADTAFSGLYELFGGGKTVGEGFNFDEDTYAKAKPLFMAAAEKFAAFKNDIGELAKRMVTHMRDTLAWPREVFEQMRPYLVRFIEDVQKGAVKLTEERPSPTGKAIRQEKETETQVAYKPQSRSESLGTLVPVNMRTSINEALAAIEKRVGPLDAYVGRELGYETDKGGNPYFMRDGEAVYPFAAEQIDAIALGIENIEAGRGFIIGDQTGIGKGRVNAGILRYAMQKDYVPVLFTAKPNLYGDMYRDLTDIGIQEFLGHDLRILATNNSLNVPLTEDEKPVLLKTGDAAAHKALMGKVTSEGFKDAYDVVFATYNQAQTVVGKDTERRALLSRLAPNAVFSFDESHEAGGQGKAVKKKAGTPDNRSDFVRDLIGKAKGVFYSSATYAKRPDVMDLYSATDMSLAVENKDELGEAIAKGGVPMQQVVAAMLAKAGQYIRRERSFSGINYNTDIVPVDRELYDEISGVLADIQDFSALVADAAKDMDGRLKGEAQARGRDNATGEAGATSVLFTSIMHNVVNQMLLAMKADAEAKRAIEQIRRGEKPVLTVANTMESLLSDYADQRGLKPGDVIDADFGDVLRKYLDRTRTLIIKKPFSDVPVVRQYLSDAELGPEAKAGYDRALARINAIPGLTQLPASPIDHIKQVISEAGYKIGEITGRGTVIDYSGDQPVLRNRPGTEISIRGRRNAISAFNRGDLDAMILNQAGSTGLSLHASEKYKDQRKRHMTIVQPEGNIDTVMQLLGRINRTGQVVLPEYSQSVADIPAEKRPAAVLAKKMASLNANTTASRGGALTAKDVPDFINEYGDIVAETIVADDPYLNARLGNALKFDDMGRVISEEPMRRVTGRIPLLPLAEQEELYARLEADYASLLQQMEAAGENALEAKTYDLKAKGIERTQVVAPKSGRDTPFAAPVYMEKVSINRLGRPFDPADIVDRVAETLGPEIARLKVLEGLPPEQHAGAVAGIIANLENPNAMWGAEAYEKERLEREQAVEDFAAYQREHLDAIDDEARKEKERLKGNDLAKRFGALHEALKIGHRVTLKTDSGNFTGIVLDVHRTGDTKNPIALSSWKATLAIAAEARQVVLPFSRLYENGRSPSDDRAAIEVQPIGWIETPKQTIERFVDMASGARDTRYIATGNLLAAYEWLNLKGRILNYTDAAGHIRQGILTAKEFDLDKQFKERARPINDPAEIIQWMRTHRSEQLETKDKAVRVNMLYDRDLYINVTANKRQGGVYFLDKPLTDLTQDFYRRGPSMVASVMGVAPDKLTKIIQRLQALGAQFVDRTEARPPKPEKIADDGPNPPEGEGEKYSLARLSASPQKQARRARLEEQLSAIVERIVGRRAEVRFPARLVVQSPPKGWGSYGEGAATAAGSYDTAGGIIRLAMDDPAFAGNQRTTAYHEAFHAVEHLIWRETGPERLVLAREHKRLKDWVGANVNFTPAITREQLDEMAPYEVRAVAFEGYAQKREQGRPVGGGLHTVFRRGFEKLMAIFRRIRNLLQGYGYKTAEDVFSDVYTGKVRARADAAERSTMEGAAQAADRGEQYSLLRRRAAEPGDVVPAPETWAGAMGQAKPFKERLSDAIDAILLNPARNVWDPQIDQLRFQRAAEEIGSPVTESLDMYLASTLYPGRVGERMKDSIKALFEPLYDAMRDRSIARDDLNDYLYARHAPERNEQIRSIDPENDAGAGMTNAEAAEIMARRAPRIADFEATAALIDRIVAFNRDLMVKEGLESQATVDAWTKAYDHYVPLKGFEVRNEDEVYEASPSTGRGFDIRNPETYRALGRFDRADDILANLKDQTMRTIIRGEKNRVAKTALRFMQSNPSPYYRIGLAEKKRRISPLTGMVEEYWSQLPHHLDRVFAAKIGGKTYWMEIKHEGLLSGLKQLGMTRVNGFLRLAMRLTREYSRLQTAKNPEFVLRNFAKDLQDASLNLSAEHMDRYVRRVWANLPRSFAGSVLGIAEKGEGTHARRMFDEWREQGGKISFYGFQDFEHIIKEIDRELARRTESTAKTVALSLPRLIDPINGKLVKLLEKVSDVSESTTRLAVYMAGRDIGLSKAEAARMARNATVDFNKGGAGQRVMSAFYAFSGANIQGNVNTIRRLRKSKIMRRAAYGLVALGALVTLWNMMISPSDPDDPKKKAYEKLKYWQREKNIHVYIPGMKHPLKLPTGFAVTPFWMLGENAVMAMLGKQSITDAIGNYLGTLVDSFNPLGSQGSFFDLARWARTFAPTVSRPVVELPLNQNWAGNKIRPDKMPWTEDMPNSEIHKAFTNPYAIESAQFINRLTGGNKFEPGWASPYPDDMQYLWDFALGGLGRFMGNSSKFVADTIDGVDVPVDRMPFVRNFVGPDVEKDASATSETYYKTRREEHQKGMRLKRAVRSRAEGTDGGDADTVIERLARETGATRSQNGRGISIPSDTAFRAGDAQLKKLRGDMDAIRKDKALSIAEKRSKIDSLQEQMRSVMRETRGRIQPAPAPAD